MSKTKRPDGRKNDEMRKIEMKLGVVQNAEGSAMFKIGKTIAIVGVYGPRELHPRKSRVASKGLLRCNYDLMSFSVDERKRPGPSRRDKELSLVSSNALSNTIFLKNYPTQAIDAFIQIPQADAGTRCAGICAASLALADAGIPMKGLVGSISAGAIGETVVLDLTKEEEDWEQGATDIPLSYCPKTKLITHLQLDGEISKDNLFKAIDMGVKASEQIVEMQEETLRKHYKGGALK